MLVDAGADVSARDKFGENMFFHLLYQIRFGRIRRSRRLAPVLEVTRLFLRAGASVNVKNTNGKTPLDVALSLEIEEGPERSELLELLSHDVFF